MTQNSFYPDDCGPIFGGTVIQWELVELGVGTQFDSDSKRYDLITGSSIVNYDD